MLRTLRLATFTWGERSLADPPQGLSSILNRPLPAVEPAFQRNSRLLTCGLVTLYAHGDIALELLLKVRGGVIICRTAAYSLASGIVTACKHHAALKAAEMSIVWVGRTKRATSCPSRRNTNVGQSLTRKLRPRA